MKSYLPHKLTAGHNKMTNFFKEACRTGNGIIRICTIVLGTAAIFGWLLPAISRFSTWRAADKCIQLSGQEGCGSDHNFPIMLVSMVVCFIIGYLIFKFAKSVVEDLEAAHYSGMPQRK